KSRGYFLGDYQGLAAAGNSFYALFAQAGLENGKPASDIFFRDPPPAPVYPTATVTSLGLNVQRGLTGDVGFWHGSAGQPLINRFNGGPDATALSSWLATNFPRLNGSLAGLTNADVAAFYLSQLAISGPKAEAQVLATALNVYATTMSLGGTTG